VKQHILQTIPEGRVAEIELLLCCARSKPSPDIIERICFLVSKGIDWDYFLRSASRHRVLPLACRSLENVCPKEIPEYVLNRLKGYYRANVARNLAFSGKLLKLLGMLEAEGIFAVPFKGPVLAEYLYGDPALRQFTDLDILVFRYDAVRTLNFLVSIGYEPEIKLDEDQYTVFVNSNKGIPLSSKIDRVSVDLHWDLCGGYVFRDLGLDFFKHRLKTATLSGRKINHFSPEDLLLYLCLHGTMEHWGMLDRICCVAQLISSRPDLNWEGVTTMARVIRCERILFLGLFMAKDLFGISLPANIRNNLKADPVIQSLSKKVYRGLFIGRKELSKDKINRKFSYLHIQVRERLSEKIRYALYLATSPTTEEWRRVHMPGPLSHFYYVFRPVRLAVGLGLVMMKMCLIKSKKFLGQG
jgi:putative nucleotidyltransferase-like protein